MAAFTGRRHTPSPRPPNWRNSGKEQRDLRQAIAFALVAAVEEPDCEAIAAKVEGLLNILWRQVGR